MAFTVFARSVFTCCNIHPQVKMLILGLSEECKICTKISRQESIHSVESIVNFMNDCDAFARLPNWKKLIYIRDLKLKLFWEPKEDI